MQEAKAKWSISVPDDLYNRLEDYLYQHPTATKSKIIKLAVLLWLDAVEAPKDYQRSL